MTHTNTNPNISPSPNHKVEPMIDGHTASSALRLPHYWFHDKAMRQRRGIPHYVIGSLVRYRMSELLVWMERNRKPNTGQGDTNA